MAWYVACTSENEALASVTEGVWLPKVSRSLAMQAQTVDGKYVEDIRSYAWTGLTNNGKSPVEILKDYVAEVSVSCKDYLDAVDANYQTAKQKLAEKFA